jgi:hypothetical protein
MQSRVVLTFTLLALPVMAQTKATKPFVLPPVPTPIESPEHKFARLNYLRMAEIMDTVRAAYKRYSEKPDPSVNMDAMQKQMAKSEDELDLLKLRLGLADDCLKVYQRTIDKKVSDQTTRDVEQIKACQTLNLYPPPK